MTKKNKGFSLIELSVVVSVAAAAVVGYMAWTKPASKSDADKSVATRQTLYQIAGAIDAFRVRQGRLPCPANPYKRKDDTSANGDNTSTFGNNFGVEDLDTLQTTAGGKTTLGIDCARSEGIVPVNSLELPAKYADDAWGRRISYTISTNLCGSDAGTETLSDSESTITGCTTVDYASNKKGDITVNNGLPPANNDYKVYTTEASYVLVSHGNDGQGAFLPSGEKVKLNTPTISTAELENMDHDTVFSKRDLNDEFDDIIFFKTKDQIERAVKDTNNKMLTVEDCQANSKAISEITATESNFLTTDLTDYQYTSGGSLVDTGSEVALGLMYTMQTTCIEYYGVNADPKTTWEGAQCPGNNDKDTNGSTYIIATNTCVCPSGLWDGNCTPPATTLPASANLVRWYDAFDIDGDSLTNDNPVDGATISTWNDKSSSSVNASSIGAPTIQRNEINNNMSIVRFNGSSDAFNIGDLSSMDTGSYLGDFFILVKSNELTISGNRALANLGGNSSDVSTLFPNGSNTIFANFSKSSGTISGTLPGSMSVTRWNIVNVSNSATARELRIGDSLIGSEGTNNNGYCSAACKIGSTYSGSGWLEGDVAEIIIYNTYLTPTERKDVVNYLKYRWGL